MDKTPLTTQLETEADALLEEIKLAQTDDATKQPLRQEIIALFEEEILLIVIAHLEESDLEALEEELAKQNPDNRAEATVQFLHTRIPDLDDIIQHAINHTKEQLKEAHHVLETADTVDTADAS